MGSCGANLSHYGDTYIFSPSGVSLIKEQLMNYDDYWYFLTYKGDVGQPTRFKAQHFEKIEHI